MANHTITVNKKKYQIDSEDDTPVLWILRDVLKLKGTKYGCGTADCGACTIHLDGSAVRSCILPLNKVGKRKITTIEGLSKSGDHPLQKAWIEEDVPQCGYCQAGQIMTAAALIGKNHKPGELQITNALSGNICRCGTYQRIKRAILKVINEQP